MKRRADGSATASSAPSATALETRAWVIAGEVCNVAMPRGRKMKKLDEAGLEICAYKQRIVDLIRSEDMLRALKTFEEMEGKNMPVDMTTVQMVSAVVSGERLELQEGAAEGKSGAKAAPRAGGQSALDNPSEAGAAAMRIYGKYVKSNATGGHLVPESVYTNVVRALCLAGRADEALEVIADLKASSHRPRLRTFAAPLAALASEDRLEDCFTVWEDALSENITLLEPEYLSLIRACAGKGGDYASFQRVMASYAEDVLLPEDPSSWDLIRKWFAAAGCWSVQDATVSPEGKCSSCARTLPSIDVGDLLMQRLADQVQELATSNDSRRAQWGRFVKWMGDCSRSKYDIIIDGANVGYYKKVYSRSSLADLQQINWVVEHYEAQGKRPLVIIHSRHLQALSGANASILKTWRKKAIVYSVEPKNNDDWYWMWAAVRIGGRVLVLTNDEMRDHHFQMLSHRSFLRWKERHQVRFSFGQWASGRRQVVVSEPSVYSKRTQCASDEANGDCWHIPLEDSDAWLCASQRKG